LSPEYRKCGKELLDQEIVIPRKVYMKPQLNMRISGLQPAAKRDMSPTLKAKPVDPGSFYSCIEPPVNNHIDVGVGRKHRDGSCGCQGIDSQNAIFDVISL
jgi:hypothetical protein